MLNPPAFPIPDVRTHDGMGISEGSPGMTLRDWLAGQALSGMMANEARVGSHVRFLEWAKDSYRLADAMLAARAGDA